LELDIKLKSKKNKNPIIIEVNTNSEKGKFYILIYTNSMNIEANYDEKVFDKEEIVKITNRVIEEIL